MSKGFSQLLSSSIFIYADPCHISSPGRIHEHLHTFHIPIPYGSCWSQYRFFTSPLHFLAYHECFAGMKMVGGLTVFMVKSNIGIPIKMSTISTILNKQPVAIFLGCKKRRIWRRYRLVLSGFQLPSVQRQWMDIPILSPVCDYWHVPLQTSLVTKRLPARDSNIYWQYIFPAIWWGAPGTWS